MLPIPLTSASYPESMDDLLDTISFHWRDSITITTTPTLRTAAAGALVGAFTTNYQPSDHQMRGACQH